MSSLRSLLGPSELRLAARILRRQPLLTLATLLALAVGIGMATTGFTLLEAVVWAELPYPDGDRWVLVDGRSEPGGERTRLDPDRYRYLAAHATGFEHLGAVRSRETTLELAPGEVVPLSAATITPGTFAALPHAPLAGRLLQEADGRPGAPAVAVVSEGLWRRRFGADPALVGRPLVLGGSPVTVVGIAPETLRFPGSEDVWLPLVDAGTGLRGGLRASGLRAFGVLRPGVDPATASAEVDALSDRWEAADPGAPKLRLEVLPFTEALSRGLELLTGILVAALLLVLFVIAANIAQLVLARTTARSGELAVRTALGASRARLVAQVAAEVLLLGIAAAGIGLAASQALLGAMRRTLSDLPFWVDLGAGPWTMLFVVLATLGAAAVAGVVPALRATRRDPAAALAGAGRRSSERTARGGGWAMALQVALSIALLNGALVMARGVAGYGDPPLRVAPEGVLTARIVPGDASRQAVVRAAAALPGVEAAGAATSLPGLSPATEMTVVEGEDGGATEPRPAPVVAADPGFFAVFGAEPVAGRLLRESDLEPGAPAVAVVNEPFVAKFLGGRNPLGRRIRIVRIVREDAERDEAAAEPWREIVGVVPDLALSAGDEALAAGFYVPLGTEEVVSLAVRAAGDARRLEGGLRAALARLDPDLQVHEVRPILEVAREDRAVFAGIGAALGAAGGMALLLSVIGTYAILSLSVTRRTREIGIRSALGASRGRILRAVVLRAAVAPAAGAVAGVALGELLVRARGIFAFRLPESAGPWGLPAIAALLIAAALASAWQPARRALAIEPSEALRSE